MRVATIVAWIIATAAIGWGLSSLQYMRKEVVGQQALLSRTIKEVSLNQTVVLWALKACERRR